MKLLVCGSTGFYMSIFLRYILYRNKNVKIVSIVKPKTPKDQQKIYTHKNNKVYYVDLNDSKFVKDIITHEKPDKIINGIGYSYEQNLTHKIDSSIRIFSILNNFNIPVIQLIPSSGLDTENMWKDINPKYLENNTFIEIPNCFGIWQTCRRNKTKNKFAYLIRDMLDEKEIIVSKEKAPWVYSEDIASFIWHILNKEITGRVKMPILDKISLHDIITFMAQDVKMNAIVKEGDNFIIDYSYEGHNFDVIGAPI